MSTKTLIIIGLIVLIIIGVILLLPGRSKESDSTSDTSGLIISNNAIYASEQMPGYNVSIQIVRLEKPGFVVIHENSDGATGKILGVSNLIEAGETENLSPITLSRLATDGQTLFAMLHFDDGDGNFNSANDKPVIDPVGKEPVMMVVIVSKDAVENKPIIP